VLRTRQRATSTHPIKLTKPRTPKTLARTRARTPEPFEHWFYIHEFVPLILFFGTYLLIVRNKKIPHVARYHIMMVRARQRGAVARAAAAGGAPVQSLCRRRSLDSATSTHTLS
jgi:hypothetical protein